MCHMRGRRKDQEGNFLWIQTLICTPLPSIPQTVDKGMLCIIAQIIHTSGHVDENTYDYMHTKASCH